MQNNNLNSSQNVQILHKGCCNNISLYIVKGNVDPCEITCSICFTIFLSPRIMKCKHVFCEKCIQTWGKGNVVTCPYCRIQIKKIRGKYGKTDKKIQKKVDRIFLKCRNCCWTGSVCQYLYAYQMQPYLEDDVLPELNSNIGNEQSQQEAIVQQQKKVKQQIQRTAQKERAYNIKQKEQERKKQNEKGMDLFINQLLKYRQNPQINMRQSLPGSYFFNPNQNY